MKWKAPGRRWGRFKFYKFQPVEYKNPFHYWSNGVWFVILRTNKFGRYDRGLARLWVPTGKLSPGDQVRWCCRRLRMRKRRENKGLNKAPHAQVDELLLKVPDLAAWLTDATFDDGSPRKGGWCALHASGGLLHLLMKDESEGIELRVSAPTAAALLTLANDALVDENAPWRASEARKKGK